jgi:hypothetical protein
VTQVLVLVIYQIKEVHGVAKFQELFKIRRSDDDLRFDCTTESGKKGFGTIASSMEGAKLGASVLFFDLGITDAITDKHRTYAPSFVIPVK